MVLLAAAAIGVVCGRLIVVTLAAADAINGQGRVYRLDLNIGLLLLARIIVQAIRAALADLAG